MVNKFPFWLIGLGLLVAIQGAKSDAVSYESGAIMSIARGINLYTIDHHGELPSNWQDIERYVQIENIDHGLINSVLLALHLIGEPAVR